MKGMGADNSASTTLEDLCLPLPDIGCPQCYASILWAHKGINPCSLTAGVNATIDT